MLKVAIRYPLAAGVLFLSILSGIRIADAADIIRVSPNGGTSSDALDAALAKARQAHKGVTISLSPGIYRLTRTLKIGPGDSGSTDAPLHIVGDPKGAVEFVGTTPLTRVPIPPQLNALIPPIAREHVRAYRLPTEAARDFADEPARFPRPVGMASAVVATQDGKILHLAQWPNKGYTLVPIKLPNIAGPISPSLPVARDKINHWLHEPSLRIGGYFTYDWYYETNTVKSIDPLLSLVNVNTLSSHYGEAKVVRYKILNAFAEIDQPGEYAIDPSESVIVTWPFTDSPVEISIVNDLVSVKDAHDVVIDGVALSGARQDALSIYSSHNITFQNGFLGDVGRNGVDIEGGSSVTISRSVITNIGETAAWISGGEQSTLAPSGHKLIDLIITDFGQLEKTYRAGVDIRGVGQAVIGSYINNGPHSAILYAGNEHLFSNNEISNVNLETGDSGAIYTGADLTSRGTRIENNYFHDIHRNPGLPEVASIYLDAYGSGNIVTSNLFVDTDLPIWMNSGSSNVITGNIFVRPSQTAIDLRDLSASYNRGNGLRAQRSLAKITPAIQRRYGSAVLSENDGIPRNNVIGANIRLGGKPMTLESGIVANQKMLPDMSFLDHGARTPREIANALHLASVPSKFPFIMADRRGILSSLRYRSWSR